MLASLCWALCVLSPAPMVSRAASRAGGVRMGEDDLSSAFAGRMRELADSEKREKEQQVRQSNLILRVGACGGSRRLGRWARRRRGEEMLTSARGRWAGTG